MLTLIVFVWLLACSIQTMGRLSIDVLGKERQWVAWGVCVSLLGHCISFFGVSYFGQITMLLYMTLAYASFAESQRLKYAS